MTGIQPASLAMTLWDVNRDMTGDRNQMQQGSTPQHGCRRTNKEQINQDSREVSEHFVWQGNSLVPTLNWWFSKLHPICGMHPTMSTRNISYKGEKEYTLCALNQLSCISKLIPDVGCVIYGALQSRHCSGA